MCIYAKVTVFNIGLLTSHNLYIDWLKTYVFPVLEDLLSIGEDCDHMWHFCVSVHMLKAHVVTNATNGYMLQISG